MAEDVLSESYRLFNKLNPNQFNAVNRGVQYRLFISTMKKTAFTAVFSIL